MSFPRYLVGRQSDRSIRGFQVVVIGSAMVGKSAIVGRFVHKFFKEEYHPTIEDMYSVNTRKVHIEILDTAGAYSFPGMRDLAIQNGDAFILVFSVDDENSFENIKHIRHQIRQVHDRSAPIIVAANKIEMEEKFVPTVELDREVRLDWQCLFYEVSAKEDEGIDSMFVDLVDWYVSSNRAGLQDSKHGSVFGSKSFIKLQSKSGRRRNRLRRLLCTCGSDRNL